MIKKIILTDSPEEFSTKKAYEKLLITRDPVDFIQAIESI
jgi:hypothetical protein